MGDKPNDARPETLNDSEGSVYDVFERAASGFVEAVSSLRDADWSRPALGEWDVRALVGHTSRALSTVDTYLAKGGGAPQLDDPIEYFLAVLADPSDPERRARLDAAVAERGQQAGAELGENPAGAVTQLAERVVTLVRARAADTPVATPAGTMTLSTYLPTRSFELTLHTLDLTRAIDLPTPVVLGPAAPPASSPGGRRRGRRGQCQGARSPRVGGDQGPPARPRPHLVAGAGCEPATFGL